MVVTKFLQKKTTETGACLEGSLYLSTETLQVRYSQHLLLRAEYNIGLGRDTCSNTDRSPVLREATCYQENKTHISSTGPKALDRRRVPVWFIWLPAHPSLGLFILVLQRAPAGDIRITSLCSKHSPPILEIVNGPAGLEAETVPARLLGRPACRDSGRSMHAAEAGHTALHSD